MAGNRHSGFASLSLAERRAMAAKGGQASANRHRWTSEEAREAGRKGGLARAGVRRAAHDEQAQRRHEVSE